MLLSALVIAGCTASPTLLDDREEAPERLGLSDYGDTSSPLSEDDDVALRDRTFDDARAREDAEADLASESYGAIGSPYGCTQDCSGHEAGYGHARDHDAGVDPGFYGSRSQSFDEGRRAYHEELEQRVEQARDDFEGGDSEYEE